MKLRCVSRLFFVLLSIMIIILPAAGADAAVAPGTVRVALVRQTDSLGFKVSGSYQLVDQSTGQTLAKLDQGDSWQVKLQDGRIQMQGQKGSYGPFNGPVMVSEMSSSVSIIAGSGNMTEKSSTDGLYAINGEGKTVSLGAGASQAVKTAGETSSLSGKGGLDLVFLTGSQGTRRYRGSLEFRSEDGKLTAVNELNIEDYLRGVVPAEIPSSWPAEALKAQAVAARNYALQRVQTSRGSSFNLANDTSSQVYKGYDAESPATNQAVEETRGMVMLSQGNLVAAYFHSSSGGYTENSEDVWGSPLPYIKGKADPYDKNDKYYNWQVNYTAEQLAGQLQAAGYKLTKVTDIEELQRTASGARVEKIAVKGQGENGELLTVSITSADKVRIALGLKSALFTMSKVYDKDKNFTGVNITGSGWGHGLGMSQWGASGMARQGYNYQDILKYYYSGINLAAGYGR